MVDGGAPAPSVTADAAGGDVIRLDRVRKEYGSFVAVQAADFSIAQGEFFAMLGPSGCGKTTTLQMIAGFHRPTSGAITLEGRDLITVAPARRGLGIVFQSYALFPHMTAAQNVAFGLEMRSVPKRDIPDRVRNAMRMVRMDPEQFGRRMPSQLSGGQRQRVALARALVLEPEILLLDEPLGALDLKLRQELQIELKAIQQQLGMTFVYVTHDQEEALTMSDRIAVFNQGRIEQVDTPAVMYEHPATAFVAGFIGTSNIIDRDGRTFTVRPEKIRVLPAEGSEGEPGTIRAAVYVGPFTKLVVALDRGGELTVVEQNLETSSTDVHEMEGRRVRLRWSQDVEFAVKEET